MPRSLTSTIVIAPPPPNLSALCAGVRGMDGLAHEPMLPAAPALSFADDEDLLLSVCHV